ncbi:MAG TPA: Npt1/Npt2 family nucleotide transporter [Acidobacteriota bacterium]|nr:Npt1/Npt2 family nucleotide transporter [Acidobacteriota bacterium]
MSNGSGIKGIFNIRKEELPFSLLMGFYFFLVITSFWIIKPIKKSLFISYYKGLEGFDLFGWHMLGSQAELLAKVLNMVVAAVAVTVFTILSRKYVRQQLTTIFSAFFIVCLFLYRMFLPHPTGGTVWTFYLFGDLYSTLMVPTFFAFLNDSVTGDQAKRLYGLVGFGGVAGGAVGATTVSTFVDKVSNENWMYIMIGVAVVIIVIATAAARMIPSRPKVVESKPAKDKKEPNAALEGAKLALRSPYLLAIVAIVGFYEMTSTIMDFQFSASVEHFVPEDRIGNHFSRVFSITNITAMIVQLFLTSFIMTRFGVGVALMVLPFTAMLGSAGFLLLPSLWTGSLLNTADNGFSYSINQSAKEALYVPTTKDEKYKAKAFIDMFVQRFAKSIAVGISLVLTTFFAEFSTIRWLSLVVMLILVAWIFAARYAGRKFDEKNATTAAVAAD